MTPPLPLSRLQRALRQGALLPVYAYRYTIGPLLPPACRFYPSCSTYAIEAVQQHGVVRGGLLAAGRLLRCHPWCNGGLDPVPAPNRRPRP